MPLPRFNLLGVHLTGSTLDSAVETLVDWARNPENRRTVHVFAADSILKAQDAPVLRETANRSDMVLTDGMPLVFIGRHFAHLDISRCYGPDVMLGVLDKGRTYGLRHFLYGGANEETLSRLRSRLESRFPGLNIVGAHVPPFLDIVPDAPVTDEDKALAAEIDASGADIVWIGLGTPKQDYWLARFRPLLKAQVLIAVGAAFNFHAGTVRQAPAWMMRCGLEWLFRLAMEPRRLWKRYLIGNPRFILLVLRQWLTRRPAPLGSLEGDNGA